MYKTLLKFSEDLVMDIYEGIWKISLPLDYESISKYFFSNVENKTSKVMNSNDGWVSKVVYDKKKDEINTVPKCFMHIFDYLGAVNILAIGYYKLKANSALHLHRDMNGNLLFGVLRIHIPIKTNKNAFMIVGEKKINLPLNTAWILDTSKVHGLENFGSEDRIHLVVDIKKGDKTKIFFPKGLAVKIHLLTFIFILAWLLVRDIFTKPLSIIRRIKSLNL